MLMARGREAVAKQNRRGESGLPCGTPSLKILKRPMVSFYLTVPRRSESQALSQARQRLGRFQLARSLRSPPSLSKVAVKSTATSKVRSGLGF